MNWKRSTACASASCVEVASSYCSNGACVLVSHQEGRILVRASKEGDDSPVIGFTPSGWRSFLVVAAEWDRTSSVLISGVTLSTTLLDDQVCVISDTVADAHLHYTWDEWDAFVKGAEAGEFAVEVLTR